MADPTPPPENVSNLPSKPLGVLQPLSNLGLRLQRTTLLGERFLGVLDPDLRSPLGTPAPDSGTDGVNDSGDEGTEEISPEAWVAASTDQPDSDLGASIAANTAGETVQRQPEPTVPTRRRRDHPGSLTDITPFLPETPPPPPAPRYSVSPWSRQFPHNLPLSNLPPFVRCVARIALPVRGRCPPALSASTPAPWPLSLVYRRRQRPHRRICKQFQRSPLRCLVSKMPHRHLLGWAVPISCKPLLVQRQHQLRNRLSYLVRQRHLLQNPNWKPLLAQRWSQSRHLLSCKFLLVKKISRLRNLCYKPRPVWSPVE